MRSLNRREFANATLATGAIAAVGGLLPKTLAQATTETSGTVARTKGRNMKPNIVYFHVDNLGYGELGCYGGGILRGADTRRIDQFAREGFQMLNFAPEAQCTPSRAALLTAVARFCVFIENMEGSYFVLCQAKPPSTESLVWSVFLK